MLIANSNLVPHWATWDKFNELDRAGLMMYGQMSRRLVDLCNAARRHRAGHLRDLRRSRTPALRQRSLLANGSSTAGLGGMGGARRWPASLADSACWRSNARSRASTSACARATSTRRRTNIDEVRPGPMHAKRPRGNKQAISVGLLGNAAEIMPELVKRAAGLAACAWTSSPTRPGGTTWPSTATCRRAGPRRSGKPSAPGRSEVGRGSGQDLHRQARAGHAGLPADGPPTLDYGNNVHRSRSWTKAGQCLRFPRGLCPRISRLLFCCGKVRICRLVSCVGRP
ncbi:hypothetical protein ACU4GD_45580 [Cupriavidus basilensis]